MSAPLSRIIQRKHVDAAMQLLHAQLDSRSRTHRCLDLELFRRENRLPRIDRDFVMSRRCPDYFWEKYIDGDALFNYPALFTNHEYLIPKGDGGVRRFNFLEWHARIFYYTLGFYCLDLTNRLRLEVDRAHRENHLETFYGAQIRLEHPARSEIHYHDDYVGFTRAIRRFVRRSVVHGHTVAAIHLDIQEFFQSVSHERLAHVMSLQTLPRERLRLKFDMDGMTTLRESLNFIMGRPNGLPLSRHNIVSNLLGHHFLYPIDAFVRELQLSWQGELRFFRYVDDMYLIATFPPIMRLEAIGEQMLDASTRLGAELATSLGLVLNPLKTRLNIAQTDADADKLIEESKLVSFHAPLPDDEGEPPREALDRALATVRRMGRRFRDHGEVLPLTANADIALRQCFHRAVAQYTRSPEARSRIAEAFEDFNPALMAKAIKPLLSLLSQVGPSLNRLYTFVRHSLAGPSPSLASIHLAEHLVLLPEYSGEIDDAVARVAQRRGNYTRLLGRLLDPDPPAGTVRIAISDIGRMPSAARQVRQMALSLARGDYNLAFNHLLNAFHDIAFHCDSKAIRRGDYNRVDVTSWLQNHVGTIELATAIAAFERRNINEISHPGVPDDEVRAVNEEELEKYCSELNGVLARLAPVIYQARRRSLDLREASSDNSTERFYDPEGVSSRR